jgi:hypothetical protein
VIPGAFNEELVKSEESGLGLYLELHSPEQYPCFAFLLYKGENACPPKEEIQQLKALLGSFMQRYSGMRANLFEDLARKITSARKGDVPCSKPSSAGDSSRPRGRLQVPRYWSMVKSGV